MLGGTRFAGRALVDQALARGHEVATFNRGRSGADVDGVTAVRGDREDSGDLDRLARWGPWDAVFDFSGYAPRTVGASARVLSGRAGSYAFVSTVSVYQGWPVEPLTEASPLLACPPDAGPDYGEDDPSGNPTQYGIQKAGCERAVREAWPAGRALIVRPGVILGPHETVGRLPWWLLRMARGGRVLAPGDPSRQIQPIDVRDVAGFILTACEAERTGVYNLTVPIGRDTFGDLLAACIAAVKADVELTWVDAEILTAAGVRQWTELPLWRTAPGTWAVSSERALLAGLRCRPLAETVRDTWAWLQAGGLPAADERIREHGMDPRREQELLAAAAAGAC